MNRLRSILAWVALVAIFLCSRGSSAQEGKPIKVGESLKGELKKDTKAKTFEKKKSHSVQLEEGKEYLIDLTSQDFDTFLRLLDADDKELAANDDGGVGTNARLGFVPKKTGTHQLVASSFGERWTGKYELSVKEIAKSGAADVKKGKLDEKSIKAGNSFPFQSFKLDLEKGKIYKIDLKSAEFIPVLQIYKEKGNFLAGDKGGKDKKAGLFFIPTESGKFDFRAAGHVSNVPAEKGGKSSYGEFTLTIQQYEFAK